MTKQELLVSRINKLSEEEVSSLLETVTLIMNTKSSCSLPDCPHCGAPVLSSGMEANVENNVFFARFIDVLCLSYEYCHGKLTISGNSLERGDGG